MTESAIANEMIELGRMSSLREAVIAAIRIRFPEALTPDVERAIADQPDFNLLRDWHAAAVATKTAEDFLAILRR